MTRDKDLDILRFVAILWVVVVHCLFWPLWRIDAVQNIVRSWILFEMPLLFFVTGAAYSLSPDKPLLQYWFTRFKRIMIPYWFFSFVCVVLLFNIFGRIHPKELWSLFFPWTAQILPLPYLNWHVWFIPIYFMVALLLPGLHYFYRQGGIIRKITWMSLVGVVLLQNIFLSDNHWVNESKLGYVLFYSVFVFIGFSYRALFEKYDQYRKSALLYGGGLILVGIVLVILTGVTANMQENKFPPNLMFGLYGLGALCLIYWAFKFIHQAITAMRKLSRGEQFFSIYCHHGYSVYLYHCLSFLLLSIVLQLFGIANIVYAHPLFGIMLFLVVVIPLSAFWGWLLGWVETLSVRK